MMKILKYFLQSIIVYFFFLIIKILGIKISRKVFPSFFKIMGPLIRSNKIIIQNLEKILKSPENKNQIIKNLWKNYALIFVEYNFLKIFKFSNNFVKFKGLEKLDDIIKKDRQVIFVSGHFSNFELMAMELTKQDVRLATIYRPLNNFFLNFYMEHLRKKFICPNQIKKGISGVKQSVIFLKQNYSIALMIDQRLSEGKEIDFFDQKAFTTTLPAQLALKFKIDIVPIYIHRKTDLSYEIEILDHVLTSKMEDNETNKTDVTLKLNKILEKMVLKDPSQWILTHDRWK